MIERAVERVSQRTCVTYVNMMHYTMSTDNKRLIYGRNMITSQPDNVRQFSAAAAPVMVSTNSSSEAVI